MALDIKKEINIGSLLQMIIVLIMIVSAFIYLQSDVEQVQKRQDMQVEINREIRSEYITREQLQYIVLDRLDRMEENINERLEQIRKDILELQKKGE